MDLSAKVLMSTKSCVNFKCRNTYEVVVVVGETVPSFRPWVDSNPAATVASKQSYIPSESAFWRLDISRMSNRWRGGWKSSECERSSAN